MRPQGTRQEWLLWAPLALLAALVWWRWRVIAPIRQEMLTILNFDLYHEVVPRLEFGFDALRRGHLPLWNPFQLSGTPFLATQQHGILYPLNVAHSFLPVDAALTLTAVLHYAVAALGCAALTRDLGGSRPAAALAGIVYATGGSMFARLYLPPHLYAATWLPLQLLLVRRLCVRGVTIRRAASLGGVCALQFLGGYGQYCLFAAYLLVGYSLWAKGRSPRGALTVAGGLALAAVVAVGLSAAQLFPAVELLLQSPRRPGVLDALQLRGESLPKSFATILLDWPFPGLARLGGLGVAGVALALGAATARRLRFEDRGFLLALVAFGLVAAMGSLAPGYDLISLLPGTGWFRQPQRIRILVSLGLSVLAAAGYDASVSLPRREIPAFVLRASLPLAAIAAVLLLTDPGLIAPRPWRSFLWLLPLLAALALPAGGWRRAAVWASVAVNALSLNYNNVVLPHSNPDFLRPPAGAVGFLQREQGYWRTLIRMEPHGFQPPRYPPQKSGMMAGLYAIGDYENLYSRRYDEYLAALQRQERHLLPLQGRVIGAAAALDLRLLNLASCRYVLAARDQPFVQGASPRFPILYEDGEARVHENPSALPRVYVAHRALPAGSTAEALRILRDPQVDLRRVVTIEDLPDSFAAAGVASGHARIVTYAAERVVIEADTTAPGFLVLTDQFYPGWRAVRDGTAVTIHRANGVFRAIDLPPGRHRILLAYEPWSVRIGLAVTMLTLLAVALAAWRGRHGDTPERP